MWVRGLKRPVYLQYKIVHLSHPMWVRGLKLADYNESRRAHESHPMWVRGLKPITTVSYKLAEIVAPHVGAWIETRHSKLSRPPSTVAPHVGAWIETIIARIFMSYFSLMSNPLECVNGIKTFMILRDVAPTWGATRIIWYLSFVDIYMILLTLLNLLCVYYETDFLFVLSCGCICMRGDACCIYK